MLRFRIPRPRSADGTLLPALLVGLLTGLLALQLVLVGPDVSAPEHGAAPIRRAVAPPPVMESVVPAKIITDRPIFTPQRAMARGGPQGDPLAGAQVSGAWSVGGRTNLVLRRADGGTRTVRVGQTVNQWVLAAVTAEGARFARNGKTLLVPFGAATPQSAPAENPQSEEENP